VLNEALTAPPWAPDPHYAVPDGSRAALERITALDLDAAPGVLHGLTYPLAPDLEGMHSPLFPPMLGGLALLGWEERVRWMRSVGLQAAVLFEDPGVPGLRLLDRTERSGVDTRLYAVAVPAPPVWWPRFLVSAATPGEALRVVTGTPDPLASVTVTTGGTSPLPFHDPAGRVRLISAAPDRIEIEVQGGGGVAVVRRAFQPLFTARAEGRWLATLPVNLNLLGVAVPAGRHRVVLAVSAGPEILAGGVALAALAAALAGITARGAASGSPARRPPRGRR
jgi:hypothetical protein